LNTFLYPLLVEYY